MNKIRRRVLNTLDYVDHHLGALGLYKRASFADVELKSPRAIYAGRLSRYLPQYKSSYIGMTPYFPSSRNIDHDVTRPMPLPSNYIDCFQSEDVFEHIPYENLPIVFNEIYRVLKPNGVFRLSVPDYGFDGYAQRSVRNPHGEIVFDPGGGGAYRGGRVVEGGHLWFPTFESVYELFARSDFGGGANVKFLHYTAPIGDSVMEPIDFNIGFVQRVPGNDPRVAKRPRPVSIVVDAFKRP